MIKGGRSQFANQRVLLLQGPMGPFFTWLSCELRAAGAHVDKIDFNGGDWLFSQTGAVAFRGKMTEWPKFFEQFLRTHKIDMVILFGDCRQLHRSACAIARRQHVRIGVFEEGYIRPDFITFEQYGVNGYSQIPRTPKFYRNIIEQNQIALPVGNAFWYAAAWSVLYYLASVVLFPFFPNYQHHRSLTILEALPWLRSLWRKGYFAYQERQILTHLSTTLAGQYFFVPLQVYNDVQIRIHSTFNSVWEFILYVLTSFARHAPVETYLVIKHHPMDRGYQDYGQFIKQQTQLLGIQERVIYIHDQHLPTILQHTRGVVLVNSTVGLSAMHHNIPLKVCGIAIYDMKGLTYQGPLDNFWKAAPSCTPDRELYLKLRSYLIEHTQLNGSFYKKLSGRKNILDDITETTAA